MSDNTPALPRVLIVDDSRIVRASIVKHIKGAYDFREESDGEMGWQTLLLDPSIQVVISDIGMPKLDGFGLLNGLADKGRQRGGNKVLIGIVVGITHGFAPARSDFKYRESSQLASPMV